MARRGHRERISGGDEWDVITGWRRLFKCWLRAGMVASIKRKMNKRLRRETKAALKDRTDG